MGERERVKLAIDAPVAEAEKLLTEIENASDGTKLSILISGWGRALAAGLEELAVAIDELREQLPRPESAEEADEPTVETAPNEGEQRPEDEARADLADASEAQLLEEARRSREATAEARDEREDLT